VRVLVTGATGFVGGRLVPALLAADHDVVALVRDAGRYDPPEGVEVVEGDLLEPGSFEASLEGVEAAYYLVHSMRAGDDFEQRDRLAARHFARAAGDAGVEHVCYLGGLGEERDRLSKHLRSRREVEAILGDGDYALTTVRAAIVVGAGSASFEMVRDLASRLPVMITPRWVHTDCQPVAVDDVIASLVALLDHPEGEGLTPTGVDGRNRTYELGGPEVLSYAEILRRTAAAMGRSLFLLPVPVLTPKLSSYWIGLVTDVPVGVARPLIAGLKNPVVVDGESLQRQLGIEPTGFDRAVERALAGGDAAAVADDAVEAVDAADGPAAVAGESDGDGAGTESDGAADSDEAAPRGDGGATREGEEDAGEREPW